MNINNHLYTGYSKLNENQISSILEFANYQTLFDKDYYVILRPEIVVKEVAKIEVITNPSKLKYIHNYEKLDLTGGLITVTYNDGTKQEVEMSNNDVQVMGFNNSELGKKTLTVKYGETSTTYDIEILEKDDDSFDNVTDDSVEDESNNFSDNITKNPQTDVGLIWLMFLVSLIFLSFGYLIFKKIK